MTLRSLGYGLVMIVAVAGVCRAAPAAEHAHRPSSHHEMMYGVHNHYYHHLYQDDRHHATATGGPSGGLPHRN